MKKKFIINFSLLISFLFIFIFSISLFSQKKEHTATSNNTISIKVSQNELNHVILNAQKNIIKLRIDNKYWNIPSYLGTHYISLYYILTKWFDKKETLLNANILKKKLLSEQQPDGSWYAIYDANTKAGDINATIYNYFALKIMGMDINSDTMKKARNYILKKGGIAKAALFTRIWLATFQNYPWEKLPNVPLFIFNEKSIINYKSFSQWVIPHIMPITYLRRYQISKHLGKKFSLKELWKGGMPKISQKKSTRKKEEMKLFLSKFLNSQQPRGSWGGYTMSSQLTIMSLMDLKQFFPEYKDKINKRIVKAFNFIETMYFKSGESNYKGVLDDGRYWDTALLAIALTASKYPEKKLRPTGKYLIKYQSKDGGFAFGEDFWYAPDIDDTAEIAMALSSMKIPAVNIVKALNWVKSMQNKDGGWGAFDKDNTGNFLLKFFAKDFLDSADLFDESSPDVTGHILESFGTFALTKNNSRACKKAIDYLKSTQDKNIWAWSARWGINYIYGTSAALVGLLKVGESPKEEYIKKSLDWIISKQNKDGGWGETTLSYENIKLAGKGISTPSQTAWALLPLLDAGMEDSLAVRRGINYLIKEFKKDGKWIDRSTVGTGHPHIIYMNYPSYPYAFPLIALSKYRNFLQTHKGKTILTER